MTLPPDGAEQTHEDEELLAALRGVVARVDPVPQDVTEMSRSLLSWRDPDARVAELVADSRELAGAVRGDGDVVLRFQAHDVEMVIQLTPSGAGGHRLIGQIEPARAGVVRIRRFGAQVDVVADDLGRFVADRLDPGPISLRWSPAGEGGHAVETAWQLL
jgi:hypothetical protein